MPAHANGAYIIKPGDRVVTPCGRPALVQGIASNGFRVCAYTDQEGGEANLAPKLLKLVKAAPVLPWPSHSAI